MAGNVARQRRTTSSTNYYTTKQEDWNASKKWKMQEARKKQPPYPVTMYGAVGAGFVFASGLVGSFFLLLVVRQKQNRELLSTG
jgi:hypothetical protein